MFTSSEIVLNVDFFYSLKDLSKKNTSSRLTFLSTVERDTPNKISNWLLLKLIFLIKH